MNFTQKATAGFTMLEIITVIVLLGVLGAVVVNRSLTTRNGLPQPDNPAFYAQLETIRSHYKYAKARAMASGSPWGLQSYTHSYKIYRLADDGTQIAMRMPNQTHDLISLKNTPIHRMVKMDIRFSPLGEASRNGTALSSPLSINLASGNAFIVIDPVSGGIF